MPTIGSIGSAVSSESPRDLQHQGQRTPYQDALAHLEPAQLRDFLSAIVDASEHAVVSVLLDGTIVLWNRFAEILYGYSASEAIGRSISLILPPDRFGELDAVIAHMGMDERIANLETMLTRKDGSQVEVSVSLFPVRNTAGVLIGVLGVAWDITHKKRIESELRRWRNQLQAIAQGVDDAVLVRGPGGAVVYANENAARLLGFNSASELLANPPAETYKRFQFYTQSGEIVPNDKLPGVLALQGIEVPPTLMRFRLLLTGQERWATVKAVPIQDEQGQVQYAASIFSDITERVRAEEALKASEARFQAFMHNAPIVAYMKDEAGRVVFLNHAWEQLFGIPIAEALGKDDFQLQPPDLAAQFHAADVEVLETGSVRVMPETVPALDGTLRHWMTFKFPIELPSGARFVGGASVEITERVRAEEELQQYAERLRALSRQLIEAQEVERRRISRDLHDQVGQALTAIKIDLQVAQHQAFTAEERSGAAMPDTPRGQSKAGESPHAAFAERLGKSIEMIERTIQQVREFSLDLRPSMLDDLGLPSALLWYAEEQARRAGFRAELAVEQIPTRLSPELEIACFRIAQEAITNVARHARAGLVSVELRRSEGELVLTVSDDGVGFDAGALDSSASGDTAGEGSAADGTHRPDRIKTLGVAGMNERVLLVGGSLSIQSAPGAGTTVRAVFPLGTSLVEAN